MVWKVMLPEGAVRVTVPDPEEFWPMLIAPTVRSPLVAVTTISPGAVGPPLWVLRLPTVTFWAAVRMSAPPESTVMVSLRSSATIEPWVDRRVRAWFTVMRSEFPLTTPVMSEIVISPVAS